MPMVFVYGKVVLVVIGSVKSILNAITVFTNP